MLGDFGEIEWLGNFQIVLLYNIIFVGTITLCLVNKFTATVRQELCNRLVENYIIFTNYVSFINWLQHLQHTHTHTQTLYLLSEISLNETKRKKSEKKFKIYLGVILLFVMCLNVWMYQMVIVGSSPAPRTNFFYI